MDLHYYFINFILRHLFDAAGVGGLTYTSNPSGAPDGQEGYVMKPISLYVLGHTCKYSCLLDASSLADFLGESLEERKGLSFRFVVGIKFFHLIDILQPIYILQIENSLATHAQVAGPGHAQQGPAPGPELHVGRLDKLEVHAEDG